MEVADLVVFQQFQIHLVHTILVVAQMMMIGEAQLQVQQVAVEHTITYNHI